MYNQTIEGSEDRRLSSREVEIEMVGRREHRVFYGSRYLVAIGTVFNLN
jgi:hypothetical protein